MIATITAIAEKNKFSDRWRVVSIWSLWSLRSLNLFFLSDRSDHSDRTDHMETRLKRTDTYTTLTDDLSLDRECDPSQSGWVLRKWNSSHSKCVRIKADSPWQQQQQWKCKSTRRLPGCYAEFITFAILLGNRINQRPFIRNLKNGRKKKQSTVLEAAILSILKEGKLLSWQVGRTKRALTKGVKWM